MTDQQRSQLINEFGVKLEQFENICDEVYSFLDYNKSILKTTTAQSSALENILELQTQADTSKRLVDEFRQKLMGTGVGVGNPSQEAHTFS